MHFISDSEHSATDYESGEELEEIKSHESINENKKQNVNRDHTPGKGPQGLASVMANILGKDLPKKKTAILAKAKTDKQISESKKEKEEAEQKQDAEIMSRKRIKTEDGSAVKTGRESYSEQRLKVMRIKEKYI